MTRSIHFGVFLLGTGNHTAGWRYPGADRTFLDIRVLQRVAAIAERGCSTSCFWATACPLIWATIPPTPAVWSR